MRRYFNRYVAVAILYLVIGAAVNTAAPHYPSWNAASMSTTLHSIVQYAISIFAWPLSFWAPTFTTGKWTP
jgi:hypothetical protein